jgi:hypothetical protein
MGKMRLVFWRGPSFGPALGQVKLRNVIRNFSRVSPSQVGQYNHGQLVFHIAVSKPCQAPA